jgi:CheY-like chemotaxis protein
LEAADSLNKGIRLRWIGSPQKALEELKQCADLPDLIFLDYNLPRINGFEMLEEFNSDSRLSTIPVILISGPSPDFMEKKLEKHKVIKYISKPSSYRDLVAILDSIL